MKYALDADHNLVPGDDLTYAYMGSGVATFTDKDGTGFRVPIGVRNLAGVSADGTVYLNDEGEPAAAPVSEYDDLTNRELCALCDQRDITYPKQPNKATLIGLLEDAD